MPQVENVTEQFILQLWIGNYWDRTVLEEKKKRKQLLSTAVKIIITVPFNKHTNCGAQDASCKMRFMLPSIMSWTSQETRLIFRRVQRSHCCVVIGGFRSILVVSAFRCPLRY